MDDNLARVVGERIRFYRTAAHKTKTVVAGLAGITPDYLYQIERGQKLPTLPVLAHLAEAVNVELADLLRGRPSATRQPTTSAAGDAIYRALTSPHTNTTEPPPLGHVHREVRGAWTTWQTSPQRYSTLTAELPDLITDTESAVRVSDDQSAAQACAADLYGLLRTVTKRIGRGDLPPRTRAAWPDQQHRKNPEGSNNPWSSRSTSRPTRRTMPTCKWPTTSRNGFSRAN